MLPAAAPVGGRARLWVDGLLAGMHSRLEASAVTDPAEDTGPLVLWASQTGNAEEFAGTAGRAARRLPGYAQHGRRGRWPSWPARATSLIVTSTFGDGGPPDNGADFWDRADVARMRPRSTASGIAVLGIGDRSYDDFCGHAKSLDGRLADLGATRILDRADCEAYDDEPMTTWADSVVRLTAPRAPSPSRNAESTAPAAPEPFTRASPIMRAAVPEHRVDAPASAAKEVRQFGFDISEHNDAATRPATRWGCTSRNSDSVVQTRGWPPPDLQWERVGRGRRHAQCRCATR